MGHTKSELLSAYVENSGTPEGTWRGKKIEGKKPPQKTILLITSMYFQVGLAPWKQS